MTIYKVISQAGLDTFNKRLAEAVTEGWRPLAQSLNVVSGMGQQAATYAILLYKE